MDGRRRAPRPRLVRRYAIDARRLGPRRWRRHNAGSDHDQFTDKIALEGTKFLGRIVEQVVPEELENRPRRAPSIH